jgi:hypothetical protein
MLAVWYWSVSYSRQAKPYILVPLLLSLVLWSLMTKRRVWAGLFGGMGMYAQAAFWGLAGLAFYHPLTLVIWSLMVLPGKEQFLRLMSPTSYVGQKMAESLTLGEYLRRIGVNLTHNIGGLLWRGDPGFRGVIPLAPFLDWVSIILFIVGVGVVGWDIWKEKKWIYWWYLVVPFFLVQLPSVLDVENFQFSPNSGRILGILPLVAVVTGMGIECLMRYIKHHAWRLAIGIMVLGWIGMLNFRLYFQTYPTTLPNENTPYGKIIADFVSTDRWVSTVVVLVDGCCWGEWGQPEPRAIKYRMKNPNRFYYLPNTDLGLRQLAFDVPEGAEVVVVSRPNEDVPGQLFQALYSPSKYELLIDGHEVARLTVGNLVNDSAFKALENGDVIEIE